MVLNRFCCCCDLRRGCIVFAWLQMMTIAVTIAILIGYADFTTQIALAVAQKQSEYNDKFLALYLTGNIAITLKVSAAFLFIKGVTCVALTFGVIKKCHLFYQPWLFISGIEVCLESIAVLVTFILACTVSPMFFIFCFLDGGLTALHFYFWFCIYTVYSKDMKPSPVSYELEYDNLSGAHASIL